MGVNEGGLITTVQPTAIAGATLRAIIAAGKFHGAIIPATPIGCLILTIRLLQSFPKRRLSKNSVFCGNHYQTAGVSTVS